MQRFSTTCLMLDAQLFLHNEAIAVVKQNYRLKVKTKLFNLLIPIINGIFL
jgi:hypothetical protein